MQYGEILSRAWRLVWQNKFLIALGFLAALSGSSSARGSSSYSVESRSGFGGPGQAFPDLFNRLGRYLAANLPLLLVIGLLALLLVLLSWLLSLAGQGGLIASVSRLEQGEAVGFAQGLAAGAGHLPPLVGLNLLLYGPFWLVGLAGLVLSVLTIASLDSFGPGPLGFSLAILSLCLVPVACVVVLALLVVTFVYPMAQRGIVIGRMGVGQSVRHGWGVVRQNLGDLVVLALIFLVLGFLVGLVAAVVTLPVLLLTFVPLGRELLRDGVVAAPNLIMAGIGVLIMAVVAAAVRSVLRAYQSTTFTLAYLQFQRKEA